MEAKICIMTTIILIQIYDLDLQLAKLYAKKAGILNNPRQPIEQLRNLIEDHERRRLKKRSGNIFLLFEYSKQLKRKLPDHHNFKEVRSKVGFFNRVELKHNNQFIVSLDSTEEKKMDNEGVWDLEKQCQEILVLRGPAANRTARPLIPPPIPVRSTPQNSTEVATDTLVDLSDIATDQR